MASKVAQAIKREQERRELLAKIDRLEGKIDELIATIEGAEKPAPASRSRKTKQEAKTS